MSQLADICDTVDMQPLSEDQKVNLLLSICDDLMWDLLVIEEMEKGIPLTSKRSNGW